ncbi:FKBP-type peptidyl-prolyl cis-trans isomerase [Microbacterium sp. 179-B 1A2 NHS]|uniref:FKBP-type peptidyl-prolyl cis-trans isomerase n=1 Tax=Microbacterium sp. 179-B 1A2 NHS TaxID=3142383 RepID=UPI00399F98DE
MRLRPIAALSAAAVSVLLFAGCGAGEPESEPTGTPASLCDAAAEPGATSEAITVEGERGTPSTATFEMPVEPETLEVSVVEEGDGEKVEAGDFVTYAMTAYNGENGDELASIGFEDGELLPTQMSPDSIFGQVFGCSPIGTRVVAAFPASEQAGAEVYVLDLLSAAPTAAWGEPQEPAAGLPEVTLAEDGTPSISVPETDAPAETSITTLKKGDGYEVQAGDNVLIQFRGARWSSGELFDGGDTWADGTPYASSTSQFVPGFQKALEGQTVGSQVLAVIAPADGYGEGEINESDLKGDTLVFVIDILGGQAAPQGAAPTE